MGVNIHFLMDFKGMNLSSQYSIKGFPFIFTKHFGVSFVIGINRVPFPAANRRTFIESMSLFVQEK